MSGWIQATMQQNTIVTKINAILVISELELEKFWDVFIAMVKNLPIYTNSKKNL